MAKPKAKGRVLIIDNYQSDETAAIKRIESAIKRAGYQTDIIKHSDAKAQIEDGKDVLDKYHAAVSSGSGSSWKKTHGKEGVTYVEKEDSVHDYLTKHEKPAYSICGGFQAMLNSYGVKIRDSGKFNRGKGEDNHHYNHKYAAAAQDARGKVDNFDTFKHQGQEYVRSFNHGNKQGVQYHPERTDHGRKELTDFLDQNVKAEPNKVSSLSKYRAKKEQPSKYAA